PWQFIARRTGAQFAHIPIDDYGELQLDALDEIATRGNIKVVANNLVSNTLGTINPVEKLAAWAHEQGAIMVVDAAQAAPHRAIDVQALGCDFLAFSSHKLCGPSGVGALWGRRELLEEMPGIRIFGPPADRRTGIVSFEVADVHPHDVAQILNWEGVAVRAGHHCTQPLMTRLGVAATTRASFYLYSIPEEIERLIAGLQKVKETFGV